MKDAKWFLLLIFLCLAPTSSLAEELSRTELLMRIDAVVEEAMARDQVVGTSIGVRKSGEILVAKGYGFADLENDVKYLRVRSRRALPVQQLGVLFVGPDHREGLGHELRQVPE